MAHFRTQLNFYFIPYLILFFRTPYFKCLEVECNPTNKNKQPDIVHAYLKYYNVNGKLDLKHILDLDELPRLSDCACHGYKIVLLWLSDCICHGYHKYGFFIISLRNLWW